MARAREPMASIFSPQRSEAPRMVENDQRERFSATVVKTNAIWTDEVTVLLRRRETVGS